MKAGNHAVRSRTLSGVVPGPSRGLTLLILCGCALAEASIDSRTGDPRVSLRLEVDGSQEHVIGDRIPIIWRFTNKSPEPLGFLWEGCCRANGRLHVTVDNREVGAIPPGKALAHMFAKAEKLDPEIPRDFDTALADWVDLRQSGNYQLTASYIGVLPNQHPRVPRGLNLWTNRAESQSVSLRILGVQDYLAQRISRENAARLRLAVEGAKRIDPLNQQRYEVTIHNLAPTTRTLLWPEVASIWIVRPSGERSPSSALEFGAEPREIVLDPGGLARLNFEIGVEALDGEPFGEYKLFVDVRKVGQQATRVPSSVLPLTWELTASDVRKLLLASAAGGKTGSRNAPLRLLRSNLSQIGGTLESLNPDPTWDHRATTMLAQLRKSFRLSALPTPQGRLAVAVTFDSQGKPAWSVPLLDEVISLQDTWLNGLEELLQLRRHLGWEVRFDIRPGDSMPLSLATKAALDVKPLSRDLVGLPALQAVSTSVDAMNEAASIEVWESGFKSKTFVALFGPTGGMSAIITQTAESSENAPVPATLPQRRISRAKSPMELEAWLRDARIEDGTAIVTAQPDLTWGELKPWLRVLAKPSLTLALKLDPATDNNP